MLLSTRRSAVWLARLLWEQKVGGSNPLASIQTQAGDLAQRIEQLPSKQWVGGSNPSIPA